MNILRALFKKELGVAFTEYVLIIALIALAAVVGLSFYGNAVDNQYAATGNTVNQVQ